MATVAWVRALAPECPHAAEGARGKKNPEKRLFGVRWDQNPGGEFCYNDFIKWVNICGWALYGRSTKAWDPSGLLNLNALGNQASKFPAQTRPV